MTADLFVYRSGHPEVVAHFEEWLTTRQPYAEAQRALLDEIEPGEKGRERLGYNSTGTWVFTGFVARRLDEEHRSILDPVKYERAPEGWRVARNKDWMTVCPDGRTKIGKAINARLTKLRKSRPKDPSFGIPGVDPDPFTRPGMQLVDGHLYLTWHQAQAFEKRPKNSRACGQGYLDAAFGWEPVKLSAYYAMRETLAERETAGAS